jgi:hypothetical protein
VKTITTILLLLGLFMTEPELGHGIIEVNIDETKEIKVFKNKGDKEPERIIRLVNQNGDIVIEENDYTKWLQPESVWLDYSQFLFRFTKIEDDWIQVIVNNETGDKKWILKSQTLKIQTWDKFLVDNTTAIEPLKSVDIKAEPSMQSKTIRKSSEKDCFEAIEIKGDWIKIKTNETLECNEHPQPIKTGWIKWRGDNLLAIKYYLTC